MGKLNRKTKRALRRNLREYQKFVEPLECRMRVDTTEGIISFGSSKILSERERKLLKNYNKRFYALGDTLIAEVDHSERLVRGRIGEDGKIKLMQIDVSSYLKKESK